MDNEVYLLLGSNLGDRLENLHRAAVLLEQRAGKITAHSEVYETEPWHMNEEPWFVNQVVRLNTSCGPEDLLSLTQGIEITLGRKHDTAPTGAYLSRTMDIDLLYYNNLVLDAGQLILPHPRIEARRFTLVPLCDVAPDLIHPVLQKTQRELLAECRDSSKVTRWSNK